MAAAAMALVAAAAMALVAVAAMAVVAAAAMAVVAASEMVAVAAMAVDRQKTISRTEVFVHCTSSFEKYIPRKRGKLIFSSNSTPQ